MTREKLQNIANDFSDLSGTNFLGTPESTDLSDEKTKENNYAKNNLTNPGSSPEMFEVEDFGDLKGMRFFGHPVFSVCRADDPGFENIRRPEVVGGHHLVPRDWLPEAKTVISFFLPYDRAVVESNKKDPVEPSMEWLYTRVDGQRFLLALGARIRDALIEDGFKAVTPYTDDRFIMRVGGPPAPGTESIPAFSTNWSERHIGVVAGLGTFGLSTCFISRVGSAGRLISVVTDWDAEPDARDYEDWLGYCNRCGACVRRCPAQAHIADKALKDHGKCSAFIRETCAKYTPRYGCGKCQSGVPCEFAPMRLRAAAAARVVSG